MAAPLRASPVEWTLPRVHQVSKGRAAFRSRRRSSLSRRAKISVVGYWTGEGLWSRNSASEQRRDSRVLAHARFGGEPSVRRARVHRPHADWRAWTAYLRFGAHRRHTIAWAAMLRFGCAWLTARTRITWSGLESLMRPAAVVLGRALREKRSRPSPRSSPELREEVLVLRLGPNCEQLAPGFEADGRLREHDLLVRHA